MDTFQYIDIVKFDKNSGNLINNFIDLVGSNPMPYQYDVNYYMYANINNSPIKDHLLTVLIEHRNTNLNRSTNHTVLNQLIDKQLDISYEPLDTPEKLNSKYSEIESYYAIRLKATKEIHQLKLNKQKETQC